MAGRVIEKIKEENKNKVVKYICPIFRFATQTFNGDKKKYEYRYKKNVTYVRFEYIANRK